MTRAGRRFARGAYVLNWQRPLLEQQGDGTVRPTPAAQGSVSPSRRRTPIDLGSWQLPTANGSSPGSTRKTPRPELHAPTEPVSSSRILIRTRERIAHLGVKARVQGPLWLGTRSCQRHLMPAGVAMRRAVASAEGRPSSRLSPRRTRLDGADRRRDPAPQATRPALADRGPAGEESKLRSRSVLRDRSRKHLG